jgi:hypothetical protein
MSAAEHMSELDGTELPVVLVAHPVEKRWFPLWNIRRIYTYEFPKSDAGTEAIGQ